MRDTGIGLHPYKSGGSPETSSRPASRAAATASRKFLSRWSALLAGVLTCLCVGLALPAHAQTTAMPSQDQLELFQNMTPEQQQGILRQLGNGGLTGGLGSRQSGGGERGNEEGQTRGQPQTGSQKERPTEEQPEEERQPAIPLLKANDWVIIEVDFHLPPRPLSQNLQALMAAQAGSAQNVQALQAAVAANGSAGVRQPGATGAQGNPQQQPGSTDDDPERQLTEDQKSSLRNMMGQIRRHNPYKLSRDGVLTLPGFPDIALLGLTEDQASMRLKVEPAFFNVDVRLTILPLKKSGAEGLKRFGYDLFARAPSTFAPVTNVPVPADYVVGAGDEFEVQLYGSQNRTLRVIVGRDGRINLPSIGPISVGGQLFSKVKSNVEARVAREMIGVRASVSMGDTRAIRVFVLGEAKRPGSYTVSGLGTITSALFAAGGVSDVGSLRKIELKRQGAVVRSLDLYDLLIRGDTTDDTQLRPGDVIFVPPVGAMVSVDGEVRRPAIYEIKRESTLGDVVQLAGGLTSEADGPKSTVTRIDLARGRVVMQVDPVSAAGTRFGVNDGDWLRIPRLRPTMDSGITVAGHVYTQGSVAYHGGLRLSGVIQSVDELMPNADIHYLLIRREQAPDRRIEVLSADLAAALAAPGSPADLLLMPRDRITVFDLSSSRTRVIDSLMLDLGIQSTSSSPMLTVRVDGKVKVPGNYPLETNMKIADLVRAGGGLADEAYGVHAELTRYRVADGGSRRTELIDVDLAAALRGDRAANIGLQPYDDLTVKEVPEWHSQESVTLQGEVRFPGRYAIRRGETLRSVIARAGGLTDYAFPEGSVFTREELRRREQEQIDLLTTRMQRDLAVLALQATAANQNGGPAALSVGETLLSQLRSSKAVGRLVISLSKAMQSPPGSSADVILRDGDQLAVPRFQQEVTVIGEVQNSTSHLFNPGLGRDDYIALSGGMTNRADRGKIYVVHANGSVVAASGSRWFQLGTQIQMKPGDTVVVPLDAEHMPALPFWQAVTSIIYNVAIAAAAVHSF